MELTQDGTSTGRTLGSELATDHNVWNIGGEYQQVTERGAWAVYCLSKVSRDPSMMYKAGSATQLAGMAIEQDVEKILLGETVDAGDEFQRLAESYNRSSAQNISEEMRIGIAESKLFLKACALLCGDDVGIDHKLTFNDYLTIMSTILTDLSDFEDPMPGVHLYPQVDVTTVRIAPPSVRSRPGTGVSQESRDQAQLGHESQMSPDNPRNTKREITNFLTTVASWKPDWNIDAARKFQSDIWDFTKKATANNEGLKEVELLAEYYTDRSRMKAPTEKQAIEATEAAFRLWLRASDVSDASEADGSAA